MFLSIKISASFFSSTFISLDATNTAYVHWAWLLSHFTSSLGLDKQTNQPSVWAWVLGEQSKNSCRIGVPSKGCFCPHFCVGINKMLWTCYCWEITHPCSSAFGSKSLSSHSVVCLPFLQDKASWEFHFSPSSVRIIWDSAPQILCYFQRSDFLTFQVVVCSAATSKRYDLGHPDAQVAPVLCVGAKGDIPTEVQFIWAFLEEALQSRHVPKSSVNDSSSNKVQIVHGLSPSLANACTNTWTRGLGTTTPFQPPVLLKCFIWLQQDYLQLRLQPRVEQFNQEIFL